MTECRRVASFLPIRPLFPTHNSALADSTEYIVLGHEINDSLVSSHSRSLRSQTTDTYLPYALPEVFNFLSQSHFLPAVPFNLLVQSDNAIDSHYNSVEFVHNGTVKPADLHRQVEHAHYIVDTGIEIKEECVQEGLQEGASFLLEQ